jgi:hypothetical protein
MAKELIWAGTESSEFIWIAPVAGELIRDISPDAGRMREVVCAMSPIGGREVAVGVVEPASGWSDVSEVLLVDSNEYMRWSGSQFMKWRNMAIPWPLNFARGKSCTALPPGNGSSSCCGRGSPS